MENPIQDLAKEHGSIIIMLGIMGKVVKRLRSIDGVKKDYLEKMVEFLHNFADKCHHGKEEEILFPELVKNAANIQMINELIGDHKAGRDYIRGITESLAHYKTGNPDAYHIAVNMEGYIFLLTGHIKKESKYLFPIADKQITDEVREEIERRFEKLEKDVIGEGKHEEYRSWVKELKNIFG